jgi:aerobic carbon-monoxide dehydrogenase small subunit
MHRISLTLNGRPVTTEAAAEENLVELLRDRFALYGARESCGQGLCGCCTVLLDGRPVSGCLYPAVFADRAAIVTIEHLGEHGSLDPIQEAFIEAGAFQCGFCTPGFVLMTKDLLDRLPSPSEEEIRRHLSGNLCRCGAYPEIVEAVKLAIKKRRTLRSES